MMAIEQYLIPHTKIILRIKKRGIHCKANLAVQNFFMANSSKKNCTLGLLLSHMYRKINAKC